jgi:HEAT repeat protein
VLALALLGPAGCAGWDEFSWKQMNFEVFRDPPEPLVVIKDPSKSGFSRCRAIGCLKEPLANGGAQADQDVIVQVLTLTATTDAQAPCRMAAIDKLRTFKDPRVVDALKESYYRAGNLPPESATVVRMLALTALGDTGSPAALDTLVRVVKEPPVEGPDVDRQSKLNERIAAARALGKFKQYQATAALVEVLKTEKDVALCKRAHESLVAATGKDIPNDAAMWAEFLNDPNSKKIIVHEPSLHDRVMQIAGYDTP